MAPGSAGAASFAATTDCQEHQAFVDGDAAAVAARLPKRYTPVLDVSSGRPLLFARAIRCREVTIDGRSAPATMASFGVVVESPDGRGCTSGVPVLGTVKGDVPPVCNWYTLFWLADNRRVIDWLHDGTPGFPAVYVPHLTFDLGAFDVAEGGAHLRFQAPPPAPSPFTIDEMGRERPGELSVRGGYWADTPQGTVKLALSTDDLTSGDATGVVHAAPGSEMAKLFGTDDRQYVPGYSAVAAEHWGHLSYRKQVLAPAQNTDSYAGSCSLQGLVTFTPPATNTPGPLVYTYDASGTCTGTLDGRAVSNAPVKLHQSGHSYGGCVRAMTTEPGQGVITFAGGESVRFTLDFTTLTSEIDATFYGERSGSAHAHGTFATQRTPPDVAVRCAGPGAAQLPMDLSFTTDSPLVSERAGGGSSSPAGPRRTEAAPLRLSVRPPTVRMDRRTTFAFRVATPDGRPVPGATVRFAGRRARAGQGGTGRIVATLRRPGRRRAIAMKSGFRGGRATVRVRLG